MKKLGAGAAMIALLLMTALSFRALAAAPQWSAASLYNQGTAFARAGKPGMAVLNYERAQLLTPGDADLEANLNAVRAAQHLSTAPRSWFKRLALFPAPSTAAWLGILGLILLGLGVLMRARLAQSRTVPLAASALGLALMALTVSQAVLLWPSLHAGVVIVRETPALVSPVPMGEPLFVLPEAETVTVTAEHEDYLLVRASAGRVGWVPARSIARVIAPPERSRSAN
jgi:hypothetical protein